MIILQVGVIIAQFFTSLYYYSLLPSEMPMHWNVMGNIDSYMPKEYAVWLMPLISLAMFILFKLSPSFDPNKKKYQLFQPEWQIIQTVFICFFAYTQGIVFYASFYPTLQIMKPLFIGMGILFILLGNYLSKIRQNYFLGIKVPWTLANEDNWNKTHRFASFTFVIMGIIVLLEGFFIWNAAPIIFGSIFLASSLPVVYSYLLFKNKRYLMRYIILGIMGVLVILMGIRMLSGEDDWICKNGKWTPHGKPSRPSPTVPCKAGR